MKNTSYRQIGWKTSRRLKSKQKIRKTLFLETFWKILKTETSIKSIPQDLKVLFMKQNKLTKSNINSNKKKTKKSTKCY